VNPYLPTYDEIKQLVDPRWTVLDGTWRQLGPNKPEDYPDWDHFPWLDDDEGVFSLNLKRDDGQRVIVRPKWVSREWARSVLLSIKSTLFFETGSPVGECVEWLPLEEPKPALVIGQEYAIGEMPVGAQVRSPTTGLVWTIAKHKNHATYVADETRGTAWLGPTATVVLVSLPNDSAGSAPSGSDAHGSPQPALTRAERYKKTGEDPYISSVNYEIDGDGMFESKLKRFPPGIMTRSALGCRVSGLDGRELPEGQRG